MLIRKTFKGGRFFKNYEGSPTDTLIECAAPDEVVIPLKQGFGGEVKPLVAVGDKVKTGQIIGRDDAAVSSPAHSSITGVVTAIKKINYFKREVTAVGVKSSGRDETLTLEGASADWCALPPQKLEELIYLSGASSLDREGIPTRYKSSIITPGEVTDVIIHAIGSEVYNLSLDVLLAGKKTIYLAEACAILKKIMPSARLHLALGEKYRELAWQLVKLLSEVPDVKVYLCPPKYPQGYDEVLVPTILGRKFPYGYSAANIGVVVLNAQAALAVYDAVAQGMPCIYRTVALCGPGFKSNPHLKLRVGTPLGAVVRSFMRTDVPVRLVLNSPLTGPALSDSSLPTDKTFSHVIALPEDAERKFLFFMRPGAGTDSYARIFPSGLGGKKMKADTNRRGEPRACVFCGFCREVCPVALEPHYLYHRAAKNMIDESLLRYGIFNCIDCNMCSYVCPSKIPLAASIKDGKEKLINMGCDQSLCVLPYFDLKGLEEYRGVK